MNIFYLDEDPIVAAEMQCNKHISKMIVETAQMLSTCHRMLDGKLSKRPSVSGKRMVPYYELSDSREDTLYKAVHFNHPCNIWLRESSGNYDWTYIHFIGLGKEYEQRYGRQHETILNLNVPLWPKPNNIARGKLTPPALAMTDKPECIVPNDPVKSYQNFYITKQQRFDMGWPEGKQPEWFVRLNG